MRVESEISNKPFETLQKELESLIDTSLDTGRVAIGAGVEKQEADEDTIMVDAPDSSEITVKSSFNNDDMAQEADIDGDAMDTADDVEENGDNIEVNTSGFGKDADKAQSSPRKSKRSIIMNSIESSETPPDSNGFVPAAQTDQAGPPTPPQSNGSFGKEPADPLVEGGILWYLKSMKPEGTSILGEHWAAGRDAVRMLSEDLTDLDDEELKGLGRDVDDSVTAAMLDAETASSTVATKSKANANKTRKRRTSGRRR